jgi:hypothetical protein
MTASQRSCQCRRERPRSCSCRRKLQVRRTSPAPQAPAPTGATDNSPGRSPGYDHKRIHAPHGRLPPCFAMSRRLETGDYSVIRSTVPRLWRLQNKSRCTDFWPQDADPAFLSVRLPTVRVPHPFRILCGKGGRPDSTQARRPKNGREPGEPGSKTHLRDEIAALALSSKDHELEKRAVQPRREGWVRRKPGTPPRRRSRQPWSCSRLRQHYGIA